VTWKQYLDDLAKLFGKKIRLNLPFGLAWVLGGVSEKLAPYLDSRPMLTRQSVGLMGRNCDVDTAKAQTELGWKTIVSYEDAMKEIRAWVQENMQ